MCACIAFMRGVRAFCSNAAGPLVLPAARAGGRVRAAGFAFRLCNLLVNRAKASSKGIESFAVTSLHLTKRIMRRFWNRPPGSGGPGDRAKFP